MLRKEPIVRTGEPQKILIVDDEPASLQLLRALLVPLGYTVLLARDGREALGVVLAEAPPIVIADWEMPEMDGLALCRALRAHEGVGFVYFIVVSSATGEGRVVEAFEAGIDDYLSKPFCRKELLARLRAGERIVALQRELGQQARDVHRVNAEMAVAQAKLEEANDQLARLATTDELTGLLNRRAAMARLAEQWNFTGRYGEPLSCIVADIDHFKKVNDTYGHDVGDLVLKETARRLRDAARVGESVCRIGGEEFLILCPKATEANAAVAAERFRADVVNQPIVTRDGRLVVSISVGVAQRNRLTATTDELLRLADDALYAAKRSGRNRVCVASSLQQAGATPAVSGDTCIGAAPAALHVDGAAPPAAARLDAGRDTSDLTMEVDAPGERPARILVVDDDPAARAWCRRMLERASYEVFDAVDGLDALTQVALRAPDVIVLDVDMPHMNGLECAARLKADRTAQNIPVIMVSASSGDAEVLAGLEAGAEEYLTKPLSQAEFVLRVRSMARLHMGRRALEHSNEVRGRQAHMLHTLLEMSQTLAGTDDVRVVLEKVAGVAAEMTCSRRVSIMLLDAEAQYLRMAHSIGLPESLAEAVRVPIGEGIAGKVFATGQPIVINDAGATPVDRDRYDSEVFASVPLLSTVLSTANGTVGVLNVTDRYGRKPFGAHDLEFINLISNIGAAAIHDIQVQNARDEARDSIVVALAKLAESRDTDTGLHLDRVTRFSLVLAGQLRTMGLDGGVIDDAFLADLERAVPLHDIGKVGIPDHILCKPGRFTHAEMEIMKTHAEIGAGTLRSVMERAHGTPFLKMAETIAHYHHEWFDGTGYPDGLVGEAIPLPARIVAVADVYDALRSKRPYKGPMSHDKAVAIINQGSGMQFDPNVAAAFMQREADFARLAAQLSDAAQPAHTKTSALRAASVVGGPCVSI